MPRVPVGAKVGPCEGFATYFAPTREVKRQRKERRTLMKWIVQFARLAVVSLLAAWPSWSMASDLTETPRLRRLGVAEGLPSRMVLSLAQDRQGYVWAATDDGLARYDGKELRVWRNDPQRPGSLPGNALEIMAIDAQDRIWVGANGAGLAMLDADRQQFRRFARLEATCPQQVWALASSGADLLVGTSGTGICRLHADGSVSHYQHQADDPRSLPDDTIYSLLAGNGGKVVWVGTASGLARWDAADDRFTRITSPLLQGKDVIRLSGDRAGGIWAGTEDGLFRVMDDGSVQPAPWPEAAQTRAAMVLHDRDGGYWMGTSSGMYRGDAKTLRLLDGDLGSSFLTARSGVLDLLQDHEGGVWMAMLTQGLAYLRPDWTRFSTHYQLDGQSLESLYLLNAAVDGDGFLIAGGHGVHRLDRDGHLSLLLSDKQLGKGSNWSVLRGSDGVVWVGRAGSVGLYRPADGHFTRVDLGVGDDPQRRADLMRLAADGSVWLSIINHGLQHRAADGKLLADYPAGVAPGLPESLVEQLRVDAAGRVWITGGSGVRRFENGRFVSVPGFAGGMVYDIAFAADGSVWLGREGLLEFYRPQGNGYALQRSLGAAEGVPSVSMGGLVLGCSGQLWATTPRGLVWWQPQGERLQVLDEGDGLPDVEFTSRPPAHAGCGNALAVSATGLVGFNPDAAAATTAISQLVIDEVHVRRDDAVQEQSLVGDVIHLGPDDRDLRITARLLSYAEPKRHRFRFRIDGYDQNWVELGSEGERILSRLPSGSHLLEIQGAVAEGAWTPSQSLVIEVAPPWWRSGWAIVAYVLLALLLTTAVVRAYRRRVQRRSEWELAIHKHELAEQASLAKTRFLATLGHEVRTPMTGVLGMSELLLDTELDARQQRYAGAIQQAGTHLLRLVNDALDLARIESGKLELENQPFDLGRVLEDVISLMAPMAERRGLMFERSEPFATPVRVRGDAMRLRQILMNLLGNAIKFTEQGKVGLSVTLRPDHSGIQLVVSDTGPGINEEQQERLFHRFEQAEGPRTASRYGGSGLGLAICQELAIAMGGGITLESRLGAGARFFVELPLPWETMAEQDATNEGAEPAIGHALNVLLVEDDVTVAQVISGLLSARGHNVVHAPHGLAALTEVATHAFDVGLLDLDLPALDGLALARQLRSSGHAFALIAVTARSDGEAERLALEAGMDGFLRKPLTGVMLMSAIAHILARNRTAQARADAGSSADGSDA